MFADRLADTTHAVRPRGRGRGSAGQRGLRPGWAGSRSTERREPDGKLKPIELADTLLLQLEPLDYTPPKTRWQWVPKTIARLRDGGTLRIVMLGDSIVNNIQSSGFNLLIARIREARSRRSSRSAAARDAGTTRNRSI